MEILMGNEAMGLAAIHAGVNFVSGYPGTPSTEILEYIAKNNKDKDIYVEWSINEKAGVEVAAGASFQRGAEAAGAMALPMGPGNTDKQIRFMMDLKATVLCSTSSYALVLAERIEEMGLKDKIALKKCMIGSELWGQKMRDRIEETLGAKLYDIYGLTELYGSGVAISCDAEEGMHYWDDYFYFEIIDSKTGQVLPDGQVGELVATTLQKEGAPLIRFRTHDITRILPGRCSCGLSYPRIDTLKGRTDDMFKVKGVNMFPKQVEEALENIEGVSSEYQIMIDHLDGRDILTLYFEIKDGHNRAFVEKEVETSFKNKIGIKIIAKAVGMMELPRSAKKTNRIFDNRY